MVVLQLQDELVDGTDNALIFFAVPCRQVKQRWEFSAAFSLIGRRPGSYSSNRRCRLDQVCWRSGGSSSTGSWASAEPRQATSRVTRGHHWRSSAEGFWRLPLPPVGTVPVKRCAWKELPKGYYDQSYNSLFEVALSFRNQKSTAVSRVYLSNSADQYMALLAPWLSYWHCIKYYQTHHSLKEQEPPHWIHFLLKPEGSVSDQ